MLLKQILGYILPFLLISCVLGVLIQEAEPENLIESNDVNNLELNTNKDFEKDITSNIIINGAQEFIFSFLSRRSLLRILNQMPCGWPELGIPALAPFQMEKWNFSMMNNITDIETSYEQLCLDGLNDMDIDKLIVSYGFGKAVNFNFNFRNVTASGKFKTNTNIDLTKLIGTKISIRANGEFNFSLQDVRFKGSFKYKLPILLGSAKIFDFKVVMSLGNVRSDIKGTMNLLPITDLMNRNFENILLKSINNNQIFVSSMLEQMLMPMINEELQGKKLWNIINWSLKVYQMDECKMDGSNGESKETMSNDDLINI